MSTDISNLPEATHGEVVNAQTHLVAVTGVGGAPLEKAVRPGRFAIIDDAGRCGIGTTSPGCAFEVRGTAQANGLTIASATTAHLVSTETVANAVGPVFGFSGRYTATGFSTFATIKGALAGTGDGNSAAGFLSFTLANAAAVQVERLRIDFDGTMRPGADNAQTLGNAAFRWSTVFAGTGAINTSDVREKAWLRDGIADAEYAAGLAILDGLGWYQMLADVERKGATDARVHFGAGAQQVWDAFAAQGLVDARRKKGRSSASIAILCHDVVPGEVEDELEEVEIEEEAEELGDLIEAFDADGQPIRMRRIDKVKRIRREMRASGKKRVTRPGFDRFGLRLDELSLFLHAVQDRRAGELEDRLSKLEALMGNLSPASDQEARPQ